MADSSGLSGNDTLTGTSDSDKLVGGGGSDLIDGGAGSDFLNAGGGNDTIIYDEADYKILGGGGMDTLWFTGTGQNLTLGSNVVSGIEKLWLDGGGGHNVWFTAADIVRVSDTDQILITGNASNTINPGTGWRFSGLTADGQSQILTNGAAKITVSLPVFVQGFSNNASFQIDGNTTLTEDSPADASALTTSGTILISDQNLGQALLLGSASPMGSTLGTLAVTLDQAGTATSPTSYKYTYQISNADVQYLGAGKELVDKFMIKTLDGSFKQLDFTTTGVNDSAAIGDPINTNGDPTDTSVTEDLNVIGGLLKSIGQISISDTDTGEAAFQTTFTAAADNLGTLSLAADGIYTYSVSNNSVQFLNAGENKTDTFTIMSADGTSKDINFTINGKDDFSFDTSPLSENITEFFDGSTEESSNATHTVTSMIDATGAASLSWEANAGNQPYLGKFHAALTDSGQVQWSFDVEDKYLDYLLEGETVNQNFMLTISDGASTLSKSITVNLIGERDSTEIIDPQGNSAGMITLANGTTDQIVRGLGGSDTFRCYGDLNKIYGDDQDDDFYTSNITNSLLRGGDGDDFFFFSDNSSGNEIYGDKGNDLFRFSYLNNQNIWGGPGSDTYQVTSFGNRGENPVLHDFDFNSPNAGGDQIDLTRIGFAGVSDPNSMNLALTQSSMAPDEYFLTAVNGSTQVTIFTLIGTNLTMVDLADNIIGYTGGYTG
jgi:VCBS repeat-containing protein